MTHIKDVQPLQQIVPSNLQKISADYSHIELTQEEEAAAIHHAKGQKDAKLKMEAYKLKLFEPTVYPKMNYHDLDKLVRTKYNVVDVNAENFEELISQYKKQQAEYFILDDANREIFEILCQYCSADPSFEMDGRFSFKKGILIFGPVGCGKTTLMRMFGINSYKPFTMIACRTIADQYSKNGSDVLFSYAEMQIAYPQQNFGHSQIGRCFDDLGTEDLKKNYGNEVNVMQDVLYKIYDNRLIGQFHTTTNLTGDEIEERYGTRIRSRMREMFNTITFAKTAPDRRS